MKMNLHHAFAPAAYAAKSVATAREIYQRQKDAGTFTDKGLAHMYGNHTEDAKAELANARKHVEDWTKAVTERAEQERAKVFTPATDPMEKIASELAFQRLYSRGDFDTATAIKHLQESDPHTRFVIAQESVARGVLDANALDSLAAELSPEYAEARHVAGSVPTINNALGDHLNGIERMLNDPHARDLEMTEQHTPDIFKDVADVEVDIDLD